MDTLTLHPTFAALCAIEEELGIGLVSLAARIADESITLKELEVILRHCMQEKPVEGIHVMLLQGGLTPALNTVIDMMGVLFANADDPISP